MLRAIVHHFSSLPSTNQTAIEMARAEAPEGTVVVAEEQTAGRGRRDRRWFSPKGEGLYHSIILRPTIPCDQAPILGFLAAVVLSDTLRLDYGVDCDLKWPNDILIRAKKCAGILLEMEPGDDSVDYVVVGIGVNLNQRAFPDDVGSRATSLFLETGCETDPLRFRQRLFEHLAGSYESFQRSGPRDVISRWTERSSYARGKTVRIDLGDHELTGVTSGLRDDGALLLQTGDGAIQPMLAGDVAGVSDPFSTP